MAARTPTRSPLSRRPSFSMGGSVGTLCSGCRRRSRLTPRSRLALLLRHDVRDLAVDAAEDAVHDLGTLLQDRPQLLPVDGLGDMAAGVTDEPGDLLNRHPVV